MPRVVQTHSNNLMSKWKEGENQFMKMPLARARARACVCVCGGGGGGGVAGSLPNNAFVDLWWYTFQHNMLMELFCLANT